MNNRADRERRSRKNRGSSHGAAAEQQSAAPQADSKPKGRSPRLWVILLICLVGSGVASFIVFKYLIGSGIPSELVGTWQVTDGPLRGATLEFRADGTSSAVLYRRGQKEVTESSVTVSGKTIRLTSKDGSGKEETVTQTILMLTDDELVIRDEDQKTYSMKRLRKETPK